MTETPAPYVPLPWPGLPDRAPEEMVARARAFYEAARLRRTCRFFAPDPVPREAIEYAIRAAGTAPSGSNHEFRGHSI
jgi:iodotyrosine deiodinase